MSTTRTKKPETWPHRRAWDTRGVSLGTGDRKSKRRGTSCEGRWEQAVCPWEGNIITMSDLKRNCERPKGAGSAAGPGTGARPRGRVHTDGREGRGTQAVSQVRLRHRGNGDNRRRGDQQSPRYRCSEQVARSVGINTDLKPKMGSGRKAQILARGVAETRRERCSRSEPAEGSRGRVSASECQQ